MRVITFLWVGAAIIASFVIGRATAAWPRFDPAVWGTLSDWVLILVTASVAVLAATLPHRLAHQRNLEEHAGIARAAYYVLSDVRKSLMNCMDHSRGDIAESTVHLFEMVQEKWFLEKLETYRDNISAVSKSDHYEFNRILRSYIDDCSRLSSCYAAVVEAELNQSKLHIGTETNYWKFVGKVADDTDYMRHIIFRRFGKAHLSSELWQKVNLNWFVRNIIWRIR